MQCREELAAHERDRDEQVAASHHQLQHTSKSLEVRVHNPKLRCLRDLCRCAVTAFTCMTVAGRLHV